MPDRETRIIEARIELRQAGEGDDGPGTLAGHAALFDSLSLDLGGFREKISPGAFAESLEDGDDVRALFNHDPNIVLGRNVSGTLRLEEDDKGLAYEIDLPDTQAARDLAISVERGDVSQNSFGFMTLEDDWERDKEGNVTRTLEKVALFDISPVTYPAYPDTDLALRSLDAFRQAEEAARCDPLTPYHLQLQIRDRTIIL